MDLVDTATLKLRQLPMPLLQEVNNFIDFLILKSDNQHWQAWTQFTESLSLAESDFSDYLSNLEAYEERLAGMRDSMVTIKRGVAQTENK